MEFSSDVGVSASQLPTVCTSSGNGPEAQRTGLSIPVVHKSSHSWHTKNINGHQIKCGDYNETMCYFQTIKGYGSRRLKIYGIVCWFLFTIGYQIVLIIQLKF